MEIKVMKQVMQYNINKANKLRDLLKRDNVLMVNIIGSPGAGKTSLLEQCIEKIKSDYRVAVIEGDVASDKDAIRLSKFDIPIILINTDGSCHLDSSSIEKAFLDLNLDELDIIFVENVGNLVCPAEFDLGEDFKVAITSTTEGSDKPEKYPLLFRVSSLVILNKMDLISHTDFDKNMFMESIKNLNGKLPVFEVSCTDSKGIDKWIDWLIDKIREKGKSTDT